MYRLGKLVGVLLLMGVFGMACDEGSLIPPLSEPEELYQSSITYMQQGSFEEAIDIWNNALAGGGVDSSFVYTGLGMSYALPEIRSLSEIIKRLKVSLN